MEVGDRREYKKIALSDILIIDLKIPEKQINKGWDAFKKPDSE